MNLRFTLGIAVVVAASGAYAQRGSEERKVELPPILKKAIQASDSLKFAGTRVVEFVRGPQKKTHTEYVLRNGEFSRVTFPDTSDFKGQVIVESKKQRRHYFPDRNQIFVGPPRREEALYRLFSMFKKEKGFDMGVVRGGEIAGQPTQLLSVTDSKGNTIQKLWIDGNTGLILRRDLLDPTGTKVGGYEYTNVDYSPNFPSGAFQLERKGATIVTPVSIAKEAARKSGITAKFIPESSKFALEHSRIFKVDGNEVLQLSYQASRSSISLFQVKGNVDLSKLKRSRDYNVYTWQSGGYSFALIGNRDAKDLQRIAQLVR